MLFFSKKVRGKLPPEYIEVHLCQQLKMSYTELEKQPFWWVERMSEYLIAKGKQAEIEQKQEEMKQKMNNKFKRIRRG